LSRTAALEAKESLLLPLDREEKKEKMLPSRRKKDKG
jgi:hypothetical protein